MKTRCFIVFAAALVFVLTAMPAGSYEQSSDFGVGIHYNVPLDSLSDAGFDTDYLSYLLTYRRELGSAFSWEIMLDYFSGSGADGLDMALIPSVSLIWGRMFNLGLGMGVPYYKFTGESGEWGDSAFLLQAGTVLPMGDTLSFNLALLYLFEDLGDITDVGMDNLTLAMRLFFRF